MKRIIVILLALCLFVSVFGVLLTSCSSDGTSSSSSYDDSNDNDYDFKDDTNDWMKDQAQDKDYGYDDGGSYYCMGKGDTCNNKTRNAYDLYCSSCDPDGDNIEG